MKIKILFLLLAISCIVNAQYKILHNFNDTLGALPSAALTLSKSTLYGTTHNGGKYDSGCIFAIDTNGNKYKDIFDFTTANGANPPGTLTLLDSLLYGMAEDGGVYGYGVIFSIDTNGSGYVKLHSFNGDDNAYPYGSLTLAGNQFYGLSQFAIFSININGSGYSQQIDATASANGTLAHEANKLYGMNVSIPPYGDIFSLDTNGNGYTAIHSFNDTNGSQPDGSLILSGSMLYGMTSAGGKYNKGIIFSLDTNGSTFKDLFDFNGTNGANPSADLIYSEGRLFGMATNGGAYGQGCIFSIDTSGSGYQDLFDFDGINGAHPYGDLIICGNILYGMTNEGGIYNDGIIFAFKDTIGGLGVNELKAYPVTIKAYPNPNNGFFTLSLSNINAACSIVVYNVIGDKVYTETLPQNQTKNTINLTGQPSGVYLYRVLKEDGELVGEGKIMIE